METKSKSIVSKIIIFIMLFMTILLASTSVHAYDISAWVAAGGEAVPGLVGEMKGNIGKTPNYGAFGRDDYTNGVLKYKHFLCADYAGQSFTTTLKLHGVIDINSDYKSYKKPELTYSGGTETANNKKWSFLAYVAWATDSDEYNASPLTWNGHWYSWYSKMNDLCNGRVTGWTTSWAGHTVAAPNTEADANAYADFVDQIEDDGKFISASDTTAEATNKDEVKFNFDKLIVDKHKYSKDKVGTDQEITITVTAQDGTTATIKVDQKGSEVTGTGGVHINGTAAESLKLENLDRTNWTVNWINGAITEDNQISTVNVKSSFKSYRGVIAIFTPPTVGKDQGRFLVGGKWQRQEDEVTFTATPSGTTDLEIIKCWIGDYGTDFDYRSSRVDIQVLVEGKTPDGTTVYSETHTISKTGDDVWKLKITDLEKNHADSSGVSKPITYTVTELTTMPSTPEGSYTSEVSPVTGNVCKIKNTFTKTKTPPPPDGEPPIIEINKLDEMFDDLIGATLGITVDGAKIVSVTSTAEDPDYTVTFKEVIEKDSKMQADFDAQNAVELFNYKEQGPVGELPDQIYEDLKNELRRKLDAKLAEDGRYQQDLQHSSAGSYPVQVGWDPYWGPQYILYCNYCGSMEPCFEKQQAAIRIQEAHQAIEDYINNTCTKDHILKSMDEKQDKDCYVPHYNSPLVVDFWYSVWTMYQRYSSTYVHLNDLAAIYTTLTGEMVIEITEENVPANYLKWANDNEKYLYMNWQKGKISGVHYDPDDNDSREIEYKIKDSTETALDGAKTESCENNMTWSLLSIIAYNNPDEIVIDLLKYLKQGTGESPLANVQIKIKVTIEELLDGGGYRNDEHEFTKTTDGQGKLYITAKELQDELGIDVIRRWTGKMEFEITEIDTGNPDVLKWMWDNNKFLHNFEFKDGQITCGNPYDPDDNDSRELQFTINNGKTADLEGSNGKGLISITAYDNKKEDVLKFTKFAELANGNGSVTQNMAGVTFTFNIETQELLDGGGYSSQSATYTKTTDGSGMITIGSEELQKDLHIDVISRWIGKMKVTITEVDLGQFADTYEPWFAGRSFEVEFNEGTATITSESEGPGEDAIVETTNGYYVLISGYDTPKQAPQIIIKKTDFAGTALEGAIFSGRITASNGGTVTFENRRTNDAGEIILKAEDLSGLQITTLNRWTGTLTVEITELKAPDNYVIINGTITATITFTNGQITDQTVSGTAVEGGIYATSYADGQGWQGSSPSVTVVVKNSFDNRLIIRKVDGDSNYQDYLDGAEFQVRINPNGIGSAFGADWTTVPTQGNGYFDITYLAENKVGDLGRYTGTLEVQIREVRTPNDYVPDDSILTVYITYANGYYRGTSYKDENSRIKLDVGESDDKTDITIAVKNVLKDLEPIYIQKVDKTTGMSMSGVKFEVTIAREDFDDSTMDIMNKEIKDGKTKDRISTFTFETSKDGELAITPEMLKKINVENGYTGEIYVRVKELSTKDGYKPGGVTYVCINYVNGNIQKDGTRVIKGDAELTYKNQDNRGTIKITINNTWEFPDIKIVKETLTNGETFTIEDVSFFIQIIRDGQHRLSYAGKANKEGQIVFDSEELETELGVNGSYTGELIVFISETYVGEKAVLLPEEVTVTLTYENGRLVKSSTSNETHSSIVDNGSEVLIKVLDAIEKIPDNLVLGGYVWQELATTKSAGVLKDGYYTKASESEYSDLMLSGIEVGLYTIDENGNLTLAEVSSGSTNPTLTDVNGYYEFEVPEGNYIVKFVYDGQEYEDAALDTSKYNDREKWASRGTELNGNEEARETRTYTNHIYSEIGSYPANYKVGKYVFGEVENRYFAMDNTGVYNIAYRAAEISDVFENVSKEMRKYLAEHGYMRDISDYAAVYRNVVKNYYTDGNNLKDPEIYNKLQFVFDSRINAYAGKVTLDRELDTTRGLYSYSKTCDLMEYDKENDIYSYKYINLGIIERDKTDLTLHKDVSEMTVSINGYDTTYKYDEKLGTYKQYIYEEDYNYYGNGNNPGGLNPDGIAHYDDKPIEVYLKYKITVQNTTETLTKLTEIVDYFDYRFGYKDGYRTTSGREIAGLEVYRNGQNITDSARVEGGSKYINASEIGLNGSDGKYQDLYVTFKDGQEPMLGNSNDVVDIYVTIKLGESGEDAKIKSTYDGGKAAKDILFDFLHNPDHPNDDDNNNVMLSAFNYAEINGYKTFEKDGSEGGFLDADSKPGSFIVHDYDVARKEYAEAYANRRQDKDRYVRALEKLNEVRQDDAWGVLMQLENNPNGSSNPDDPNGYYHRTMKGNVWEAVTDTVHTSTNLYNDELLTYIEANGVNGIIVELVELAPDGAQVVRARTVTDGEGNYQFKNYIAGNYTVRFIYGSNGGTEYYDEQNDRIRATTNNDHTNAYGTYYGINGQYYQSTKANPETDFVKYWYAKYTGERDNPTYEASSNPGVVGDKNTERYSDAYDEVNARIRQIDARTAGTSDTIRNGDERAEVNNSWSWNYEWNGVENVQKVADKHTDQIEAYTSTMNIEIEYTKQEIQGNQGSDFYRYEISGVDFGVTPRAESDLTIDKYVSNVKLYLQDGTKQLDVYLNENGSVNRYENDAIYQNIVIPTTGSQSFRDGLLEVLFDEQLLNGTTLEITYTITTTNTGESNTITYFYETEPTSGDVKPIALAYYNGHRENLEGLVYYEQDRQADGITKPIVNHDTLEHYRVANAAHDLGIDVRTRAANIVDYIDPALNFTQVNKEGQAVNPDWELTTTDSFNTTRKGNTGIMDKYNTIIRAKGGKTYDNYLTYLSECYRGIQNEKYDNATDNWSELYRPLLKDERNITTLTLSKVLETTSTDTNDYEYSNLIEISKLENYAGKAIRMEGYDITGVGHPETSQIRTLEEIENLEDGYGNRIGYKTLGTSKSETISIHAPTGLSIAEEAQSNLSIVLIVLIVFATGLVLIKKFVLTPKIKE